MEQDFRTEEEAGKWFEEQFGKVINIRGTSGSKPTDGKKILEEDAIDNMLNRMQVPMSRFANIWEEDQRNHDEISHYEQNVLGRYPKGFRHYENYANYSQVHTDATVEEYMDVMNRQVTYSEFVAITRQGIMEHADRPGFKQYLLGKWGSNLQRMNKDNEELQALDFSKYKDRDYDCTRDPSAMNIEQTEEESLLAANMKAFTESEQFENLCKEIYPKTVQEYLLNRDVFTLVACLEAHTDLTSYGRDPFRIPLHNSYVPVRHTIMPKPDLSNKGEELGYVFGNRKDKTKTIERVDPLAQLSPLKGTKMNPRPPNYAPFWKEDSGFKYARWRRLSQTKHSSFSTLNRQPSLVKESFSGVDLPANLLKIPSRIDEPPFRQ